LKFFSNPLILAILTASLGFVFDRIMNNIEHRQLVQQQHDKQSADLIMKAFDDSDPQVIMTKLMLLDTLHYIQLSDAQDELVVRSFAQRDGSLPSEGNVENDHALEQLRDTVFITINKEQKPLIKPRPPVQLPINDSTQKVPPNWANRTNGFTILVGTDILRNEANAELILAQSKYPDARQYQSGRYFLTVVGKYKTFEEASKAVADVRKKLNRPDAYAIHAQK
jgi:hypothetical protein